MADLKISALPASTTPLAGTEVLPIVQSGTTKQVSIDNVTAGRTVNANKFVATTNIAVGNASAAETSAYLVSDWDATYDFIGKFSADYYGKIKIGWALPATGTDPASATYTNILTLSRVTQDVQLDSGNLVQGTAAKGINFTANTPLAGMTSQLLNWYEEGSWTIADASGAGLVLTVTNATYTKIGRTVFIQFYITYPITASAVQAAVTLPYTAFNYGQITGRFGAAVTGVWQCQSGAATAILHSINGGAAITNASLSGQYMLISGVYQST